MIKLTTVEEVLKGVGLIKRNTVGVAFSGGGVRGFSHLGLMLALEKFDIKPSILSGVSAGSIASVLYGAGLAPQDIAKCFAEYPKFSDFSELTIPKSGLFKLNRFAKILESWLPVKNLEELAIPTVVCATDFEKGTSVGWSKGEIVPRVIASCSIPVLFEPVKIDDTYYVDGGVLRNLPAWAIRSRCKLLIGSNCNPLDRSYKYKNSVKDIMMRTYQLMLKANALQDLNLCDLVVQSQKMASYSTFDMNSMNKIIREGYDVACRTLENYMNNKVR